MQPSIISLFGVPLSEKEFPSKIKRRVLHEIGHMIGLQEIVRHDKEENLCARWKIRTKLKLSVEKIDNGIPHCTMQKEILFVIIVELILNYEEISPRKK